MALPFDIWRHILSLFDDPELRYRISILSKSLYGLVKPHHQVKLITATTIFPGDLTTPWTPSRIWDECIADAPWVKVHPNRKDRPIIFKRKPWEYPSSSRVVSRITSKDQRYTREIIYIGGETTYIDSDVMTIRSATEYPVSNFPVALVDTEAYDFFDQQYVFDVNGVTAVYRYHIVAFVDGIDRYDNRVNNNDSDSDDDNTDNNIETQTDEDIERDAITRFLSQHRYCEFHWYQEERELHMIFELDRERFTHTLQAVN